MSKDRFIQRFEHFNQALAQLEEAVVTEPTSRLELDGLIQRFEFSFELSWKVLKDWLNYKGFEVTAPRDVLQKAFQENLIHDFDTWLKMLELRNISSHEYSLEKADELIKLIQELFFKTMKELQINLEQNSNE